MMDTDPEKAKSYLHELSEHVEAVKVLTTKNQVLDYIINSKMVVCRTKGIAFTYEVQDDLKQMQDFDLISLLSNALDNAIEAQDYVDNKFISCKILDGKTATKILIENACDTVRLQKSEDTYLTIKQNKGQHGIGMGRIKTIAESYHGYMKVIVQGSFLLEISIPRKKCE
ncbi:MAG: GHKL domain-containing protein [[Clostridium] innocuum]